MWLKPKDYAALGAYLASVRKSAGVSQDDLAARLEKPQSFVSSYERGQRRVDVLELLMILEAIKIDPAPVFAAILKQAHIWIGKSQNDA